MSDLTPIRFDPAGPPEGLQRWPEANPADLVTEIPVEHGHEYYADPSGQLTAGIWTCSAFESKAEPYPVDEFMLLLEGEVILVYADGHEASFTAGEAFVIPKGTVCAWRQPGDVRKFYLILDDGQPASPLPDARALRLDPSTELPEVTQQDPARYTGAVPRMWQWNAVSGAGGQWLAGIWQATSLELVPARIARSEFAHLLEGEAEIVNGDGRVFSVKAGDSFLVPVGMGYQWRHSGTVRKLFCSFTPAG